MYHEQFPRRALIADPETLSANKFSMDIHHNASPQPSVTERKHLTGYTLDSSVVNGHLIRKDAGLNSELSGFHEDNRANHIEKFIKSGAPLHTEMSTFSGIHHELGSKMKIGSIVHTPAFTSSSISPYVAAGFAHPTDRNTKGIDRNATRSHILHFKLPKGYNNGRYLEHFTANEGEHEYLLNKNQKWKVTGHQSSMKRDHDDWAGKTMNRHTHVWTLEPHSDEGN